MDQNDESKMCLDVAWYRFNWEKTQRDSLVEKTVLGIVQIWVCYAWTIQINILQTAAIVLSSKQNILDKLAPIDNQEGRWIVGLNAERINSPLLIIWVHLDQVHDKTRISQKDSLPDLDWPHLNQKLTFRPIDLPGCSAIQRKRWHFWERLMVVLDLSCLCWESVQKQERWRRWTCHIVAVVLLVGGGRVWKPSKNEPE